MAALIGIARLAAESPLVAAKRQVEYFEIPARSILNRTKPNMPFAWTLNPYRGCELGCKYCYARYTHGYMGLEDPARFEDRIYAKAWAARTVRRELARVPRGERIAIGTVTDPYQPAERRFGRTREILEVLAGESGRAVSLTTKSGLVLRDVELLREVARRNVLDVNLTVTTHDERLARLLEPRAPRPAIRLAVLAKLREAGLCAGVFANPVMPGLTDSQAHLNGLAEAVAAAGGQYLLGGPLFLMPTAERVLLPVLEEHFPGVARDYRRRFALGGRVSKEYRAELDGRVERARERFGLAAGPVGYKPELWEGEEQGSLW